MRRRYLWQHKSRVRLLSMLTHARLANEEGKIEKLGIWPSCVDSDLHLLLPIKRAKIPQSLCLSGSLLFQMRTFALALLLAPLSVSLALFCYSPVSLFVSLSLSTVE